MTRGFVILSLAAGSAVLFAGRPSNPAEATRAAEIARLHRHFDSVDVELRSRDVSGLTTESQARRARLMRWLREYRDASTFSKNDKFNVPKPFFRDSQGTLCAMAYLIDRSGRRDIVDKVVATRNNAYIRDLVDDPALVAWLDSVGLTVAEAARIQPTYGGIIFDPDARDHVSSDFALAAVGLGSASLATSVVNVIRPSYLGGFLGIIAGTAAIIVGADHLDENRGTKRVAAVTTGLGAVSLGAGIYGLLEARREHAERERGRWRNGRGRRASFTVAPDLTFERNSTRAGLLIKTTF